MAPSNGSLQDDIDALERTLEEIRSALLGNLNGSRGLLSRVTQLEQQLEALERRRPSVTPPPPAPSKSADSDAAVALRWLWAQRSGLLKGVTFGLAALGAAGHVRGCDVKAAAPSPTHTPLDGGTKVEP
jgi:hypothetical protein